jgi:hypothetical protein
MQYQFLILVRLRGFSYCWRRGDEVLLFNDFCWAITLTLRLFIIWKFKLYFILIECSFCAYLILQIYLPFDFWEFWLLNASWKWLKISLLYNYVNFDGLIFPNFIDADFINDIDTRSFRDLHALLIGCYAASAIAEDAGFTFLDILWIFWTILCYLP